MSKLSVVYCRGYRGKVTPRQQTVFDLFEEHKSLTKVANILGISPANVQKHLASYHRNVAISHGVEVPSVSDLLRASNDGANAAERMIRLASSNGVTDPGYILALQADNDGDDDEDGPQPINPFASGEKIVKRTIIPLPKKGVGTWIDTCAQDATPVHELFWANLLVYRDELMGRGSAEIRVAPATYAKAMFGDYGRQERTFLSPRELHYLEEQEIKRLVFFDQCLDGFIVDECIEIDGRVDLCAHMNTLPTAAKPLSGLETHTGPRWGIFPHVKQHLESVPRHPKSPPKVNLTTGACTLPNYIKRKAGMKAEFHHTIGFTITEVLPDGTFWVRQVEADPVTGDFQDLDRKVSGGVVTYGNPVATISYGDVHHEKLDPEVAKATWGYDVRTGKCRKAWLRNSLFERLRPSHQFFHDISDFAPRNHHNIKNARFQARMAHQGTDSVEQALKGVADFLEQTKRDWCTSVVVQSNHDNAYQRWLDEADIRQDGLNARLYFWANSIIHEAIARGEPEPAIFPITLLALNDNIADVVFIDENDTYVVAGIEHSQHGHMGPNGSRGGPNNLFKIAEKLTTGHTHSPHKRDGLVIGGVCSLDMGYNKGPTSWAIAHVIGHHDGTRQILFMNKGRFAA